MDQPLDPLWDLLADWEFAYRQGRDIPAAELCREQPHLRDELQRNIDSLKSMDWLLVPFEEEPDIPVAPAQEAAASDSVPECIGEYTILGRIGQGGMGQVFQARHRRMDRLVALKLLPNEPAAAPAAIQRFQHEVRAAATLLHPNVVTAFDAGEHGGRCFLAMEYIGGVTLQEHIETTGPLPVPRALDLILQTARGLAYAHRSGVVHRDIKPANLILSDEGVVKILDLGLARAHRLDTEGPDLREAVMGTADYLPPEAIETGQVDHRGDIYALGCTLWFVLAGKPIFGGGSPIRTILAHQEASVPSLRAIRPDVPAPLEDVYQKMVAKQPEDRFPTMGDVIVALQDLAGQSKTVERESSRRRVVWLAGLSLVAAALVGIVLQGLPGGEQPTTETTEPAPIVFATFDQLNARMNLLDNWKVQRGKWVQNEKGEIVGEGSSSLLFLEKLPPDFVLRFDMVVVEGMRPRVYFETANVQFGNEGYDRNLDAQGSGILESVNEPYRYKQGEILHIRFALQGPTFALHVNNQLTAKGRCKLARSVDLRICAGDSWSPGTVRFANFRITEP